MSLLSFPNELLFNVADYLDDDPKTLASLIRANRRLAALFTSQLDKIALRHGDINGITAMLLAAWHGNERLARLALGKTETAIWERDRCYNTPIHRAAIAKHTSEALIKLLLEKGSSTKAVNFDGRTPLHCAVIHGRLSAVRILLEHGADPNAPEYWINNHRSSEMRLWYEHKRTTLYPGGKAGKVLLSATNHPRILELLLENGADITVKNPNEETALHWAAIIGQETSVRILLERGADIEARNRRGESPLHVAIRWRHEKPIKALLKHGANANARIHDSRGLAPLHQAAEIGSCELFRLLLNHGARIDTRTNLGLTVLHLAVANGRRAMASYVLKGGVGINIQTYERKTALHLAAVKDNWLTTLLLENGADDTIEDKDGKTALELCAWARVIKTEFLKDGSPLIQGLHLKALLREEQSPLPEGLLGGPSQSTHSRSFSRCLFENFN